MVLIWNLCNYAYICGINQRHIMTLPLPVRIFLRIVLIASAAMATTYVQEWLTEVGFLGDKTTAQFNRSAIWFFLISTLLVGSVIFSAFQFMDEIDTKAEEARKSQHR